MKNVFATTLAALAALALASVSSITLAAPADGWKTIASPVTNTTRDAVQADVIKAQAKGELSRAYGDASDVMAQAASSTVSRDAVRAQAAVAARAPHNGELGVFFN